MRPNDEFLYACSVCNALSEVTEVNDELFCDSCYENEFMNGNPDFED